MKQRLSDYFKGVASKILSAVEVDSTISNQHELHGVNSLREMLGPNECRFNEAKFIYLGNDIFDSCTCVARMTWYDSRVNQPDRTAEYRFYYQTNEVMTRALAGDLLVIGLTPDDNLVVIVAQADTPAERQLAWLFDTTETGKYTVNTNTEEAEIGFVERYILSQLDIYTGKPEPFDEDVLHNMINRFGETFPTTTEFSAYARETLSENISADSDEAIIQCVEREEALFMILEEHIVQRKLKAGFTSVDEFANFAKSWINRRYARAGYCFENHLKYIFEREGVMYSSEKYTEGRKRPDFIFPHINAYHHIPDKFINDYVTMLAAKTSAKDRWRQVLNEADRLDVKYLITLEPSISEYQTDEMRAAQLQLVVPKTVERSYTSKQQEWLLNLDEFLAIVKERQSLDWQQYIPMN